jgi:hypothetical protein
MLKRSSIAPFVVGLAVLGGAAALLLLPSAPSHAATRYAPAFEGQFLTHWSDGNAELNGYRLTQPRYGALREGKAVTVFVKQPFSERTRVKPNVPREGDGFAVMKLNHIEDFQTGIYDYNLLTSSFVGLQESGGRPAGALAKVSFSMQEWCGHTYAQLLFDKERARLSSHSYFDGEADRLGSLELKEGGLVEDSLWLWARGMAAPVLQPGAKQKVPFLRSLKRSRLQHKPLDWVTARVSRSSAATEVTVPAGTFTVDTLTVGLPDGLTLSFYVEQAFPHRIIKMEGSDGEKAELLGTTRQPYWRLHQRGHEAYLDELGFKQP